jgi:thiol:disulfide interchange protein
VPLKYKLAILLIVGVAVLAALFWPGLTWITGGEEAGPASENSVPAGAQFVPSDDPFMEFARARADGKPIVLEFYARW